MNSISTNLLRGKGNPSPYVQKVQSMKLHKMVEVLQNNSKLFLLRKERKVSRITWGSILLVVFESYINRSFYEQIKNENEAY